MNEGNAPSDDRKTYYVSVGAGQILQDREEAAFEFSIRANEAEIDKLQELFQEAQDSDEEEIFSFEDWPTVSDTPDNEFYESQLKEIYRMLHELGTAETKKHIESMNVL